MPMLPDDNDGALCPPTSPSSRAAGSGLVRAHGAASKPSPAPTSPRCSLGHPRTTCPTWSTRWTSIDTVPTHTTSPSSRAAGATSASDVDDPDGLQGDGEDAVGELEGDNGGSSFSQWPLQVHPGPYPPGRNLPRLPCGHRKASYQGQAQAGGLHQIQHSPGVQALFCSGRTARPAEAHEGARLHQRLDPCTRCCAVKAYLDLYAQDPSEEAVKAIRAATRLGNKKHSKALAAVAADTGVAQTEVP